MRVTNQRSDLHDVVRRLAIAQHVKQVDQQLDRREVCPPHGLGAFENGVDEIAFAAVQRLDHEGDPIFLRQWPELTKDVDVLFERLRG